MTEHTIDLIKFTVGGIFTIIQIYIVRVLGKVHTAVNTNTSVDKAKISALEVQIAQRNIKEASDNVRSQSDPRA